MNRAVSPQNGAEANSQNVIFASPEISSTHQSQQIESTSL